jgi:hypothetical protein
MCVYMHSRFVENHSIWILEDGSLISEVVLSQGSAGWWEMMRGECSSHFGSGRGWRLAQCSASRWRRSVGYVLRKKKAGRGRLGRSGGRDPVGRGRVGQLGRKEGGRVWAESRSWTKVQERKSFQILFGIWISGKF